MKHRTQAMAKIFAIFAASFIGMAQTAAAQPTDGKGPPPPSGDDNSTNERLGDTSILMGAIQIPRRG